MEIIQNDLDGVVLIKPNLFKDDRGYFFESYNSIDFNEKLNAKIDFIQDNESMSNFGTLRGFHLQLPPHSQSKLVRVTSGKVQDVVIDLRPYSEYFGNYKSYILSDENKHQLFIPKGFAHAFLVLSKSAIFNYKVDYQYTPNYDTGLIWNDADINVDWEIDKSVINLSAKDLLLPNFKNYKKKNFQL